MRGSDRTSGSLFSYVDIEALIPKGHPLRSMREIVNAALGAMEARFETALQSGPPPSILNRPGFAGGPNS